MAVLIHYQKLLQDFNESRSRLSEMRARLNNWNREAAQLLTHRETISRDLAVLEERRRSLNEGQQNATQELARLADEIRLTQERHAETEKELTRIQTEFEEAQSQQEIFKSALVTRQSDRAAVEARLQTARQNQTNFNTQKADLNISC